MSLGVRYGSASAAFIRVNYGLQRHAGGGMAVRNIACLPAITGHWRRAGGGVQLSTSANFTFNRSVLERPDLGPPARTINMIRLGEALTEPDAGVGGPPVKALVVYNSNPAAVAPDRNTVLRGLAREDLFTVVLEHFQTDTCDWADIVLPATTQLEHWDVHLAYGHHYASLNRPSIAPLGEALPNTEIFRRLAARIGMTGSWTWDDDLTLIRQALDTQSPKLQGVTFETLLERGWVRLNVPTPYLPYAEGEFSTPSGKCEFFSQRLRGHGARSAADVHPAVRVAGARSGARRALSADADLVAGAHLPELDVRQHHLAAPAGAGAGGAAAPGGRGASRDRDGDAGDGAQRSRRLRGAWRAWSRRSARAWCGRRASGGGSSTGDDANANQTTSQRETDLGHGPVFYDNQVEIDAS